MPRELKTVTKSKQLAYPCRICGEPILRGQTYYGLGMRGSVHAHCIPSASPPAVFPEVIFGEEGLLSSQAFSRPQWKREQYLYQAILEDAILGAFKYQFPRSRREERLEKEVIDWLNSTDISWPCSFVNCCHAVDLDPDYLRKGVLNKRQERRIAALNAPTGVLAKIAIPSSRKHRTEIAIS